MTRLRSNILNEPWIGARTIVAVVWEAFRGALSSAAAENESMSIVAQLREAGFGYDSNSVIFVPRLPSSRVARTWPNPAEARRKIPAVSDATATELRRRVIALRVRKEETEGKQREEFCSNAAGERTAIKKRRGLSGFRS